MEEALAEPVMHPPSADEGVTRTAANSRGSQFEPQLYMQLRLCCGLVHSPEMVPHTWKQYGAQV